MNMTVKNRNMKEFNVRCIKEISNHRENIITLFKKDSLYKAYKSGDDLTVIVLFNDVKALFTKEIFDMYFKKEVILLKPYTISKKEFISTMTLIKAQYDHDRKCTDAFAGVFREDYISGYDNNNIINATINLLSYVMDDTEEWIEYFMFETDFGAGYEDGDISIDKKNIPLRTFDDLWEILVNK